MNNKIVLRAEHLTKDYGKKDARFRALDDVNLEIAKGESVAIIGKSGSGKSTLMHSLALLDKPTNGEIFVNGTESTKISSRKLNKIRNKTFGFVFQQFFMNGRDTVLSNVELPLKIAGVSRKSRHERALKALEIVELKDKARNKANDLSGGQKQRVCIARALVNDPSVIFADEPTGNLDSRTGEKVEDLLFGLSRKGITLIVVTHDIDLAKKCDRAIHIKDGKIVEELSRKQMEKGVEL